jgi:hypothetical protein
MDCPLLKINNGINNELAPLIQTKKINNVSDKSFGPLNPKKKN